MVRRIAGLEPFSLANWHNWESMRKRNLTRSRSKFLRRKSTGQSVVEVTMFLPLIIMIVLVVIDFGIVFASYLSLVNAAREGAVFAAMYPQIGVTDTSSSQCVTGSISPTVSSPHDPSLSDSGTSCIGYQDDKPYTGGGGITNTTSIWNSYVNRIKGDSFIPVAESLEAAQLVDQDTMYIDRPVLGSCSPARSAGCFITVTVHYRLHTFTSDISLPGVGRFGLPNYYQINYSVGMPIR